MSKYVLCVFESSLFTNFVIFFFISTLKNYILWFILIYFVVFVKCSDAIQLIILSRIFTLFFINTQIHTHKTFLFLNFTFLCVGKFEIFSTGFYLFFLFICLNHDVMILYLFGIMEMGTGKLFYHCLVIYFVSHKLKPFELCTNILHVKYIFIAQKKKRL